MACIFYQVSHSFMKHCMIWFPSCHIFPPVHRLWNNNYCMALGGKNIIYFPPVGFLCSFSVTIKIIGEKILYYVPYCLHFFSKFPIILLNIVWFDFPLAIFSPYYTVSESRTIIAWSNGEKKDKGGKNIIYFPLVGFLYSF